MANVVVGVLGGLLGGWLAQQLFGNNQIYGWIGAFVVALIGAVIVRDPPGPGDAAVTGDAGAPAAIAASQ